MNLQEFNLKYKYKSDKEKFSFIEVWETPKLQDDGFYYGDCESYCLFLKNNIEQFEDWDLYYCKQYGNGHCILSDGVYIIDCNCQKIMRTYDYKNKYKIYDFKKYSRFVIFSKYLFAKVFLFFNKGN